jgi:hypothetical protein
VPSDEALGLLVHGPARRKGDRLCSLSLTEIKIELLRLRHTRACGRPRAVRLAETARQSQGGREIRVMRQWGTKVKYPNAATRTL